MTKKIPSKSELDQFCNRAYRRDFTFDEKGRTRAVADIGPAQRQIET